LPIYATKDGKSLVPSLIPLQTTTAPEQQTPTQTEIPKTDKPLVELFIWSYCPYGVQAQAPLAEVVDLIGNSANFKAILYYDGHGEYETQQNKIQACIQQENPSKYWSYAKKFVSDIYPICGASRDVECDMEESITLMKSLGIDSNAILECVDKYGEDLIEGDRQKAQAYGVTGSPTLTINGVKTNTARTAEAYKQAICSAFTEESRPASCDNELSGSTTTTTGGSC
jgi:hypothetical protein